MKKPYRFWTTKEAAYLREHYPREAAKLTGVSEANVNRVRRGEAWKDLSTFGSERLAGAGAGR